MPRLPKSVEQHKVDGTFRPDRHSERVSVKVEAPPVPSDLTPAERELWLHVTEAIPMAKIDSLALRCLVESWRLYRRAYDDFVAMNDKDSRITWKSCQDAFLAVCRQFGMTPASRAQLRLPEAPADDADAFADILNRMKRG